MSRITIVPDDRVVNVDGEAVFFDYSFSDSTVNDVQWFDTVGSVGYREFVNGENVATGREVITDFSPYEYLLPLRQQAMEDQCNARNGWHWDSPSDSCVRDT